MSSITTGIKLAPLLVDIKTDIKTFKDDMSNAANIGVGAANKISKELANVSKVGEKLSNVGDNLTKYVTLPLVGATAALGKMAFDTENDLSTLGGRLGTTREETEKLKEVAKSLYNNGFGESLEDCVNDLVNLQQNIKATTSMTDDQKEKLLEQISTIKKLFGVESSEITRTLNNMLQNGIIGNVQEGLDVITRGFQEGLNSGGDLLDVLYEYSPQFKKLGLDGSDSLAYIKAGLDAGAYNADKMADALKELSIRAIDGSDTTIEGFKLMGKNAEEMMRKFSLGGESAKGALKETIDGLKNIKDPLEQDLAGVDLFGTMWEDSSKQAIFAMADVTDGITDVTGATERAGEEVNNSLGAQFTTSLREAKDAFLPLGIEILDLAKTAMPSIRDVIRDISEFMGNLTDEQRESIIKWGGIAIAAGPVLKILGGGIQTFVNLKSIIGGTSTALGLFKTSAGVASTAATTLGTAGSVAGGATGVGGLLTSLGGMALTALPFVAGAAAIGVAAYGIHKTLSQEVIPTVDLFADKIEYTSTIVGDEYGAMSGQVQSDTIKITEATQEAVQAYMNMDDDVTKSLYSQKVKQETVTEEMASGMIGKFNSMAQTIKNSQQTKYEEMTSDLTNFFNGNSSLTEVKESEILQKVAEKNQAQQAIVDETMEKITEIYNNAKNENRSLKESELNEVTRLQEQMRINAINSLSATEEEAAVIRQRMKDYQGRLSAEMASEMIIKANEARDGEIKAANEKYDGVIRQATRLKEAGYITQKEYDNMVDAAEDTRDQQIKKANEASEGIRKEIEKATPGISREVELQTGKIKTWYNRAWDSISGFFSDLFSSNSRAIDEAGSVESSYSRVGGNIMGSHYNGLNYVPFDGYTARLHKGERVLTAEENKDYTQGSNNTNGVKVTNNFYGRVDSPYEVAKATKKSMRDLQFA